jgi:hypothetical protein
MMKTRTIAGCLLALWLAAISSTVLASERAFYAGSNWTGTVSFDDQTGALDWCEINASYRSGITLHFAYLADFSLLLILENPNWELQKDREFPIHIQVDNHWEKSLTGRATDQHTVAMFLGTDLGALDALRFGQELELYAARDTLNFLLTGTSLALAQTAKCILQNTQSASQRDPFSVNTDPFGSEPANTSAATDTAHTTAAELTGFLTGAGLGEVRMMSDADRKKNFPNAQLAWTSGQVFGLYTEFSLNGRTAEQAVAQELGSLLEICHNKSAGGNTANEPLGHARLIRFVAACDDSDNSWVVSGTTIIGDQTGVLIEQLGTKEDAPLVTHADDLVADEVRQLYH